LLAVGEPARWVSFNPVFIDTPLQKGHHVDLVAYGANDTLLDGVTWRKSRHSNPSGNCVELAGLADGTVAIRNSRHPAGPALLCGSAEFAAFLAAAREGEFDSLLG
jgi:Domain of unknown function (DUF397)